MELPSSDPLTKAALDHPPLKVLLVEDDPDDVAIVQLHLASHAQSSVLIHHEIRLDAALAYLANNTPDAVMLDLGLPDSIGLNTLDCLCAEWPDLPVVVLTNLEDSEAAITAMREGAQDYLVKGDFNGDTLYRSIRYAIERVDRRIAHAALATTRHGIRIAQEIQTALLPASPPELEGFEIAGATFAAEIVNGDYYDFMQLANGTTGITIGDACGHGLPAALLSVSAQACLRSMAHTYHDVAQIMQIANSVLAERMVDNRFVTMIMTQIDPRSRTLTYVNAGHPTGLVIAADGLIRATLSGTAMPLGVEGNQPMPCATCETLQRGDLVLLMTDGVHEALSKQDAQFGIDRALDVVKQHRHLPAAELIDRLYQAIIDFCEQPVMRDDITFVVIKCLAQDTPST